MNSTQPGPLLVVTVLLDAGARAAAITRAHGDAMERAMEAAAGLEVAGIELVELPVAPGAFAHLRRSLTLPPTTPALYDIFPVSATLDPALRTIAGQFLAAEALWTMEGQGLLGSIPPNERLSLPAGWTKDPKEIRQRLVDAGATQLDEQSVRTYAAVKERWDAGTSAAR